MESASKSDFAATMQTMFSPFSCTILQQRMPVLREFGNAAICFNTSLACCALLQKEEAGAVSSTAANGSSGKEQASRSGTQGDTGTDLSAQTPVELTPAQVCTSPVPSLYSSAASLEVLFFRDPPFS